MNYIGNCWPTLEQRLLLQAGLFPEMEAKIAWAKYCEKVDLQKVDSVSLSLLPLVYRNLKTSDSIPLKLCKGKYRHTWVSNHVQWQKLTPVFERWAKAGAHRIVVLKGMAMILQWYGDFGSRVIGDIDVLVEKQHLPFIVASLLDSGWQAHVSRFDPTNTEHLQRWHALNFTHPSGSHLDVHWSLLAENAHVLDASVLEHAVIVSKPEPWLCVPHPTELLLQTCIHGVKHSDAPLIRWIADAYTLLKSDKIQIDWERMLALAQKAHVCLPLSQALQFLNATFTTKIPSSILKALEQSPVLHLEYKAHWCYARGIRELGAWYRFCVNQGYHTWISRMLHMPKYLQNTARLRSLWMLPFFLLYWICKRIRRALTVV